jgi:hypothetical protein
MSEVVKFDYKGQNISFRFSDGNKMINATEMAKPFEKRINNFLRQKSTQEYILLLEERYADEPKREVLRVIKGGEPELQGTWMDEKLALKFAAWLAPMFELWLFDKIYELLTTGKTEIKEYRPANILKSLRLVVEQLEEQEKINAEIRQDVDFIAERIDELEIYLPRESVSKSKCNCALHFPSSSSIA